MVPVFAVHFHSMAPTPEACPPNRDGAGGQSIDQSVLPSRPTAASRPWSRRAWGAGAVAATLLVWVNAVAQPEHAPDSADPSEVPSTPPPNDNQPAAAPPAATPPAAPAPKVQEVETELRLNDGRQITGVLVDQDDFTITLRVAGIETPFPRSAINRVRTRPSVEEEYKAYKAKVRDLDFLERLKIADWLRSKERYELSLKEIEGILTLDPRNVEAAQLRTRVLLEQDLASRRMPPGTAPKPRERKSQNDDSEFPLLTDDQINLIRVFEVDLNAGPRLTVSKEAIERLIETYGGHDGVPTTREGREAFLRKPASEILTILFRLRAREMYNEVRVLDHPPALRAFRDDVHNSWFLNSCATTACHGGPDAGRLHLANKGTPPDRIVYTNFLIMDRFRLKDGRPLIDWDHPAESPLLLMALPRGAAGTVHPEVRVGKNKVRWRSVLSGDTDPRYKKAIAWIESMYRPRPDYPIDYEPPKARGGSEGSETEGEPGR